MPYFTKKGNYLIAFFCVYAGYGNAPYSNKLISGAKRHNSLRNNTEHHLQQSITN